MSKLYLKNVLQPEQRYPSFSCSQHSSSQRGNKHENLWTINFAPPLLNKRLKAACYLYPAVYLHTTATQETWKLALSVNRWEAEWRQSRGPSTKCRAAKTRKGRDFKRRSPPGFCHACVKFPREMKVIKVSSGWYDCVYTSGTKNIYKCIQIDFLYYQYVYCVCVCVCIYHNSSFNTLTMAIQRLYSED